MKPIITVYSGGTAKETKKFESFIEAAFWIGIEHLEGDLDSVRVRQPNESYDTDVANLSELSTLLVQRQINFSIEFFTEPLPSEESPPQLPGESPTHEPKTEPSASAEELDYETELDKLKEEFRKGLMTKKQYESRKSVLLKKWKEGVDGGLIG